jgi:hypothetical protein
MFPKEIINIIMEYYINDLNTLIKVVKIFPIKFYNVREYRYFDQFFNAQECKRLLCNYIQQTNLGLVKTLLISFDFTINSDQFADICKYNSLDIVKTIYENNKAKLNVYPAIYETTITFNNKVLEWLYFLL